MGVGRPLLLAVWLLPVLLGASFGPVDTALATTAEELCDAAADPCDITTQTMITDQSVLDFGSRALRIRNGGALVIGSGTMTIRAGSLTTELGGALTGRGTSAQPGGTILVEATGSIILRGTIEVSGAPGGFLSLHADDQLEVRNTITGDSLAEPNEPPADFVLEGRDILITDNGKISAVGGGEDNAGGDVSISARRDLEVSQVIDVSGGEGGVLALIAGEDISSGGDIRLRPAGELIANGLMAGGGDGEITLDATGDGIETGHIVLAGKISADGKIGSKLTSGGFGGCVDIAASGDVRREAGVLGSISLQGKAPDGSGGLLSLDVGGSLALGVNIIAGSIGAQSEGGSICIDVGGDANVLGSITNMAGAGGSGDITISSDDGTVRIDGLIDVSGTFDGRGGDVCLASGGFSGDRASSVIVNAPIRANGSGDGGGGGIELDGTDVFQLIESASLEANGGGPGARGGSIVVSVSEGPAILQGAVSATGSGNGSAGGIFTVDATQRINIIGPIDLSAQGGEGNVCSVGGMSCQTEEDCLPGDICRARGGGFIDLTSSGPIDLNGPIKASSNNGGGGRVDLLSDVDIRIGNSVVTDGNTTGGRVDALACMVTVCGQNNPLCPAGATGSLSSRGSGGTNHLVGRGRQEAGSSEIETSVVVLGSIIATAANELVYTQGGREPFVLPGLDVSPTPLFIADSNLTPCPICGNGVQEPGEECDDGNTNDGDGCSSICQMEEAIPGDANGDQLVNADDVDDLILEIFDGDGDSVTTVSSSMGTFPGNPGADANLDRLINAADVTAAIELILGP